MQTTEKRGKISATPQPPRNRLNASQGDSFAMSCTTKTVKEASEVLPPAETAREQPKHAKAYDFDVLKA
jgi:hypothetical protein